MFVHRLFVLIPLIAFATPSLAGDAQVVAGFKKSSDLSELLVAASGKLVEKQPIPALRASVLEGRGAWNDLDARKLARAVEELAARKEIALRVEANATSRATGECCNADRPQDPEL